MGKATLLVLATAALSAPTVGQDPSPKVMVGKSAPALKVNGWSNTPALSLAKLKGKVVVLDFWAYW